MFDTFCSLLMIYKSSAAQNYCAQKFSSRGKCFFFIITVPVYIEGVCQVICMSRICSDVFIFGSENWFSVKR